MDLTLISKAAKGEAAEEGPASKRGRTGAGASKDGAAKPSGDEQLAKALAQLTIVDAKIGLAIDKRVRDLSGHCFVFALTKPSSPHFLGTKYAQAAYRKVTHGKKGHGQGAPDGWGFIALATVSRDSGIYAPETEEYQKLTAFIALHHTAPSSLEPYVSLCNASDGHNSESGKIEIGAKGHADVLQVYHWIIGALQKEEGTQVRFGRAPRGSLARKSQHLIDKIGKMSKGKALVASVGKVPTSSSSKDGEAMDEDGDEQGG